MDIVASDELVAYVRARGGRVHVWLDRARCCSGAITYLGAGVGAPGPSRWTDTPHRFRPFPADGFEVLLDPGRLQPPAELHLELKGRRRPRIEAYWNGCIFAGDDVDPERRLDREPSG